MEPSILLSFLKELSAEVSLDRINRFLNAFLSNFYKGYLDFNVFIGESKEKIKPLFDVDEKVWDKNKNFLINIKNPFFRNIKEIPNYSPKNHQAEFIYYYPFYRFREFFGFILIEFGNTLAEKEIDDLNLLSSFLGPIFFSSYLYEKEKEAEKRFEISYDLALFSTRVFDSDRIIEYLLKTIYEGLFDIEAVVFYEIKGNILIPKAKRGKADSLILPIEFSFPGNALRKMKTNVKANELACLVPTRDFVHGILYIRKKKGTFDEDEIKTFEMVSNTLSVALENANFVREIRERKESLEEEIKNLIEKRIEEERVALVGKIAASIVHELKNLVAGVLSVSEIIEIRERDEKIKELVRALKEEAEIMEYLLISLLEIAKPFSLRVEENSIKEMIEKAFSLSKFFVKGKKIDFKFEIEDDFKIMCDKIKMELSLLNLFKNGIEAIERKGEIRVFVEKNEKIYLKVEDTGRGIEEEYLDKIFEPFFSKKEKGAGLGLSFVKKVMEAHGFKIRVSSIIGKGTKFIIEIPKEFIKGSNP